MSRSARGDDRRSTETLVMTAIKRRDSLKIIGIGTDRVLNYALELDDVIRLACISKSRTGP
jgi:hypothetical protein